MTKNKWRTLILTSLVILSTMIYGASQYASLPKTLVTHWGIDNEPNGWMPKAAVVYGLPLLMLAFHLLCVGVTYAAAARGPKAPKLERVIAWIFPVITVVAYVTTIRYAQGANVDTRLWAVTLIAALLIVLGNYLPTAPVKRGWVGFGIRVPWSTNAQAALQKLARTLGYTMVGSGAAILLTLFFPPMVTWVAILAFIAAILIELAVAYFRQKSR
ncbi:DUF1648 domain-containing protein [Lacticaseibacillus mingshuiensis]|uniref:DUF1648 domain-containing protein n=1 Tax=Lacticaseibacillus mingshuiensis TaxID=2799574 RepID=A0ABW4CG10_9LACO|nr:DUF1648 domain-containing protein [Lacticaseibacillus mingshuiensis]